VTKIKNLTGLIVKTACAPSVRAAEHSAERMTAATLNTGV